MNWTSNGKGVLNPLAQISSMNHASFTLPRPQARFFAACCGSGELANAMERQRRGNVQRAAAQNLGGMDVFSAAFFSCIPIVPKDVRC
jgi:hypothetical protein